RAPPSFPTRRSSDLLLKMGDHLICSQHIFGNTNSLLGTLAGLGVDISFVDATDAANVRNAWRPQTRMVFTETLANPGTQVADLRSEEHTSELQSREN